MFVYAILSRKNHALLDCGGCAYVLNVSYVWWGAIAPLPALWPVFSSERGILSTMWLLSWGSVESCRICPLGRAEQRSTTAIPAILGTAAIKLAAKSRSGLGATTIRTTTKSSSGLGTVAIRTATKSWTGMGTATFRTYAAFIFGRVPVDGSRHAAA